MKELSTNLDFSVIHFPYSLPYTMLRVIKGVGSYL